MTCWLTDCGCCCCAVEGIVKRRSEETSMTLSVGDTMIVLLEGTQYVLSFCCKLCKHVTG